MLQGLFVEFECLLVVLLSVLHLAQNEAEVALQLFYFSPKISRICSVRSSLKLKHLLGSEAEFFALLKLTFEKEMFR